MDRQDARESRKSGGGLSPFEKFVETVNKAVSSPPAFAVTVLVVVLWLVSAPVWSNAKAWQVVIHTVGSVLTLLLLVLLENAGRRSEEAAQEKLNVLAEALAALMDSRGDDDPELQDATRKLREAVGLEERH